jgi:glucose/arabinose dehydrogenase
VSKLLSLLAVLALASLQPAYAAPTVAHGFTITQIANVPGARELAFAPNGDLFVGTGSSDVYIVPHAGAAGAPGTPRVFVHLDDTHAEGVSFANGNLYIGTDSAVWRIAYRNGDLRADAPAEKIASVRAGSPPAGSDGDVHLSTSVAAYGNTIYASAGSSCNACVETDPTRATIGRVENGKYVVIAKRIRNAIALAVNPATGSLWAGNAGQDELPPGHPYEIFDDVTARRAVADYGWPFCYEDRRQNPVAPWRGQSCNGVAVARVVFPAYETPIGAVFYPAHPHGRYAFPASYTGGAFVTLHGSWHGPAQGLSGFVPPRVVFVPMHGDTPARAVNWSNPNTQWTEFIGGYQQGARAQRIGRPTGIAVGPQDDLFIADDQTGNIYRVRP